MELVGIAIRVLPFFLAEEWIPIFMDRKHKKYYYSYVMHSTIDVSDFYNEAWRITYFPVRAE